jgi:flagellar biosynthesis/type III secretory pathway protein FliH
MDKIIEALSKMLPEENMSDVKAAISTWLEETKTELENEYNKNLEQAYEELSQEVKNAEATGEKGYQEAWNIISDLRNRMEVLKAEYQEALEEGYKEAYEVISEEKKKNETIETDLHEEYERRFEEAKSHIVEKVDEFLKVKGKEIYEMARRDIMSDPSMIEHKIVLDKIVESVSDYISDEDKVLATSSKFNDMKKAIDEATSRVKMLEAKNIRLSTENNKLNEGLKQAAELIAESNKDLIEENRKVRAEKSKSATGRGEVVTENTKVIAETVDKKTVKPEPLDSTLLESFGEEQFKAMKVLSGLAKEE